MSSFRPVTTPGAFTGEGRCSFSGRCFCFWQDGTRALGTVMWGRPLEADIAQMVPFWEVGAHPRFKGHASVVDGRGLESIDVLAFKALLSYLTARRHVWGPNIARQAIIHPGGVVGVIVAGALLVARPPNPFRTFSEDVAAQAFTYCRVPELYDEVEELRRSVSSAPEVVRDVQRVLKERGQLTADEIARALGLSSRTLQRRLEAAGTSLRAERHRHLSLQIEELLSGTDLDLDAIAAKLGLASASHLVRQFRGTHGVTPGEWREQRRRAS